MHKTSDLLKAAKALIDTPDKWTQKSFAKTKSGQELFISSNGRINGGVQAEREGMVPACFCLDGAIRWIAKGESATNRQEHYIKKAYKQMMGYKNETIMEDVWVFNDNSEHEKVMELFDIAIKLAEADND